ncbi:dienelactone hydrolase family protein [Candidatus Methylospira mobilis]|uniref:Dienelactone hydrolase family protein n=1 Tax=Candidatus Methylospira mobilis TaxID=1808979 RepID=A0A5Q0BGT3_9GAMM|nr:dienelactone hydrolase family protein [Candidatus Methylospira mobilis]QFY42749.1 dienelactone hydrolase family protein [Candidatus Methylospira mobilis]WNV04126.1 dienelactone hydrolase family protein [Candidatus Methylospira mobilis]
MTDLTLSGETPGILPDFPIDRRGFIAGVLSAGFALAVRSSPASETLIHTGSEGLASGEIEIETANGKIPAYRSAPAGSGTFPVILVAHEIFGVHEHIRDITRRLARLGYLAIAPELFHRQGDVSRLKNIDEIRGQVLSRLPDEQVLSDLDAAVVWADEHGGDPGRLGITGFCWGGRITWLYAAHQPRLKAGVAWYGRLVGEHTALTPRYPIDVAGELKAPVLGLYGGQDQGIPLDTVKQLRAALKTAGSASEIQVYPDAPHAFYADYRPSYHKASAEDGWQRLQAWFKAHGL